MHFINPIEILELGAIDIINIDNNLIKKAKRKLQAEIELSDSGYIEFNGLNINKSDAESAINELDNKERIEFYYFIANHKTLSSFLSKGDLDFFKPFRQESIYKLQAFVDFIGPYFSESYDKASIKAFQDGNSTDFAKIISINPIVGPRYFEKAYRGIFNLVKDKIKELDQTAAEIESGESIYDEDSLDDIILWVEEEWDKTIVNLLPTYFQGLRNQAAQSIRNLSVNTFNVYNDADVAINLLGYALSFNIDGITKQKLTGDHKQLKDIADKRIEEQRHAPVLKRYASVLVGIREKLEMLEKDLIFNPTELIGWIRSSLSVNELNSLDPVFNEIRNQLCLGLRALSVGIWNGYQNIEVAYALISVASEIRTTEDISRNIADAKRQLLELKRKVDAAIEEKKRAESSNTGCIAIVVVAVIGVIIYAISQSNTDSTNHAYTQPQREEPIANREPIRVESAYKGNQLKNGNSPFDLCFGEGVYSGNATLTIKNGSSSDAIVCLYKTSTGQTVRNEYVRKNSEFTMSKLGQGYYKIRTFYGNDWNPTKLNGCGTYGDFDSDISFSEFDQTEYFEDNEGGYTIATITLYTVAGGNASTSPIGASKFFNK